MGAGAHAGVEIGQIRCIFERYDCRPFHADRCNGRTKRPENRADRRCLADRFFKRNDVEIGVADGFARFCSPRFVARPTRFDRFERLEKLGGGQLFHRFEF